MITIATIVCGSFAALFYANRNAKKIDSVYLQLISKLGFKLIAESNERSGSLFTSINRLSEKYGELVSLDQVFSNDLAQQETLSFEAVSKSWVPRDRTYSYDNWRGLLAKRKLNQPAATKLIWLTPLFQIHFASIAIGVALLCGTFLGAQFYLDADHLATAPEIRNFALLLFGATPVLVLIGVYLFMVILPKQERARAFKRLKECDQNLVKAILKIDQSTKYLRLMGIHLEKQEVEVLFELLIDDFKGSNDQRAQELISAIQLISPN